jgi:tetratricopeptide (TPR) repeat protein
MDRSVQLLSQLYFLNNDMEKAIQYAKESVEASKSQNYKVDYFMKWEKLLNNLKKSDLSGWKKLIEFLPADTMKLKALEYAVENAGSTDWSNQTDIKQFLRKAGILSSKYGLHSKAINYYKTLIQIDPISNSTHVLLAEQYYLTKDLEGFKKSKVISINKGA